MGSLFSDECNDQRQDKPDQQEKYKKQNQNRHCFQKRTVVDRASDPNSREKEYFHKVIIGGSSSSGKTAFAKKLAHNIFLKNEKSTLGIDFHMKILKDDGFGHILQMWDLAGNERFSNMINIYMNSATSGLIIIDLTNDRSFLEAVEWCKIYAAYIKKSDMIIFSIGLIFTKDDLLEETELIDGSKTMTKINACIAECEQILPNTPITTSIISVKNTPIANIETFMLDMIRKSSGTYSQKDYDQYDYAVM